MYRWDDLTPEEQARYADREQLRAQLAAVNQRAEAAEAAAKNQRNAKDAAITRNGELHRELHTMRQRAEAAEAKLAAVPVDALRRTLFTGYRTDAQIAADADAINDWLAKQEV